MLNVLVSEYTVFADLARAGLTDAVFRIPGVCFAAVDLLLAREFTAEQRALLGQVGVDALTLSERELLAARDYQRSVKHISLTEAGSLVAAKERGLTIFAGYGHLRLCAEADGVSVVDVLWAMDRLGVYGILKPNQMRACLETLRAHPRCRLPQDEVAERMSRWLAADASPSRPSSNRPMTRATGKA
jgi:hypothetical protein